MIDLEKVNLKRKAGTLTYAGIYLYRCHKESKSDVEIDMQILKQLSELDTKLGTAASEQLFNYVSNTTRWDIIKVRSNDLNLYLKIILDYRF